MKKLDISREREILKGNYSLEDKVSAAATLWQLITECEQALQPFKLTVRDLAQQQSQPIVTFDGHNLSRCVVTVQSPALKLRDGLKLGTEQEVLGEHFDRVYAVKLTLHSTDPASLDTLPWKVRRHMSGNVTLVTYPPRVSLRVTLPTNIEVTNQ